MVHFNWKRRRGLIHFLSGQHLFFLNMVEIPRYEGNLGGPSYSCTHIKLGTDVDGEWSDEGPGAVPWEKTRCPLNKTLGEPQSRTGEKTNPSSLPGFQLRIVQPVTR